MFNLQIIFGVASFFVSIYALKYDSTPRYLKYFIGYTLVAFLLVVPGFFIFNFMKNWRKLLDCVYLISTVYHYIFLGTFIIAFTNGPKKRWIYLVAFIFLSILIYSIVIEYSNEHSKMPISIASFGLIVLSLIYFYRLLKYPSNVNLINLPVFWIITGVFLSMGLQFPFSATFDSFYKKVSFEKYSFLYGIITFSYVILHAFIIKSYLCSIKNSKKLLYS